MKACKSDQSPVVPGQNDALLRQQSGVEPAHGKAAFGAVATNPVGRHSLHRRYRQRMTGLGHRHASTFGLSQFAPQLAAGGPVGRPICRRDHRFGCQPDNRPSGPAGDGGSASIAFVQNRHGPFGACRVRHCGHVGLSQRRADGRERRPGPAGQPAAGCIARQADLCPLMYQPPFRMGGPRQRAVADPTVRDVQQCCCGPTALPARQWCKPGEKSPDRTGNQQVKQTGRRPWAASGQKRKLGQGQTFDMRHRQVRPTGPPFMPPGR